MPRKNVDPNAPPKPLSSFNLFTKQKLLNDAFFQTVPFNDRLRVVSIKWAGLDKEEKQRYIDESNELRKKYNEEFEKYKQTDSYKQWNENRMKEQQAEANSNTASKKRKTDAYDFDGDDTPDKGSPDDKIQIFSQPFLDHNQQRENSLRILRKRVSQWEEETALLSKHVDSLSTAEQSVHEQERELEARFLEESETTGVFFRQLRASLSKLFDRPASESSDWDVVKWMKLASPEQLQGLDTSQLSMLTFTN